jgi:excisionase family DNA binding protein
MSDKTTALTMSVDDVVTALGVGKSSVNELIYSGKLRSFKVGRRRLVLRDDLDMFIAGQLAESQSPAA